jgi:thiol-disulfide isomerase/thioredoxin
MVERRLRGEAVQGFTAAEAHSGPEEDGPAILPPLSLRTVAGAPLKLSAPPGRPVLVEIWATWCPPCRSTLSWLDRVQREHGTGITVLALAVDSPEADVRRVVEELNPSYHVALGSPSVLAPFGPIAAVPTLLLFDSRGARVQVFYGAPPDLHANVERHLAALLAR